MTKKQFLWYTHKNIINLNLFKTMEQTARENFEKWNAALQTKDPQKVAELYTTNSTFHPTMSGNFEFGQEGAEGYFEHFLLKNPFGKIVEDKVQTIDDNSYVHSGLYDFVVGPAEKRETVKARFTFIWQKDENGDWKIIHHHSSQKP